MGSALPSNDESTRRCPHCGILRSIEPTVHRDRINMNVNTAIAAAVREEARVAIPARRDNVAFGPT